jgi:seryl-tRNA synthetase
MLDIKDIRKNPDRYKKDLARKGVEASVIDALLEADQKHREALQKTEEYKRAQNEASKKIPTLSGEEKSTLLQEMKTISEAKKKAESDEENLKSEVFELLCALPNPPLPEVPNGGEDDFEVIKEWGDKPHFSFQPKEHWEIAENLGILDTTRSAKVSGSRFYYLREELAILQMALMNWAFLEIKKLGFSPTIPPFMTRKEAIFGTGFLEKDQNYIVNPGEDDLYLIGTSEVPLTSFLCG